MHIKNVSDPASPLSTDEGGTISFNPELGNDLAALDTEIAKQERLVELATECGFHGLASEISRDLDVARRFRDFAAKVLRS